MSGEASRKLPAEPLLRAIAGRGRLHDLMPHNGPEDSTRFNTVRDQITRSAKRGWISDVLVDELCVHVLRVHPYSVYGDLWWDADELVDEEDDDE